jgi:hypothetical protein
MPHFNVLKEEYILRYRKWVVFIMMISMLTLLGACSSSPTVKNNNSDAQDKFIVDIIEIRETSILVDAVDEVVRSKQFTLLDLHLSDDTEIPADLKVGERVEVTIIGPMTETYPGGANALKITRVVE